MNHSAQFIAHNTGYWFGSAKAYRLIIYLLVALLLAFALAGQANAHSLRLFARVEGQQVNGYAFFIGGGRPNGVGWIAQMGTKTIASGKTNAAGEYEFTAPAKVDANIKITVDTQEGHIATTILKPERFQLAQATTEVTPAGKEASANPAQAPSNPTYAALSQEQLKIVEQALEHQLAPLLERVEEMDARMRLSDVLSGIFLIIGLAGIGLWAYNRKK